MKKLTTLLLCFFGILIFQNCSSSKKVNKSVVLVSYEKDLLPIMQASCTPCHFPPDGRKEPLNNYDAVKSHLPDIITRIKLPQTDNRFMPFKSKKPALSDSLINVFVQWQNQNMPQ